MENGKWFCYLINIVIWQMQTRRYCRWEPFRPVCLFPHEHEPLFTGEELLLWPPKYWREKLRMD